MKVVGIVSTAALSLLLGITIPAYAQEDKHEDAAKPAPQEEKRAPEAKPAQQEEKRAPEAKPAQQEEKKAQPEKPAKQEENTKQQEKGAQQQQQKTQQAKGASGGRIPDDRYKANFGREHTFHVSQGEYGNHRFQYGGYWFGFAGVWPSNWLYTQDVFVVEINGVYYLCNPMYPGVNIELIFAP